MRIDNEQKIYIISNMLGTQEVLLSENESIKFNQIPASGPRRFIEGIVGRKPYRLQAEIDPLFHPNFNLVRALEKAPVKIAEIGLMISDDNGELYEYFIRPTEDGELKAYNKSILEVPSISSDILTDFRYLPNGHIKLNLLRQPVSMGAHNSVLLLSDADWAYTMQGKLQWIQLTSTIQNDKK